MTSITEVYDYLEKRGSKYGISLHDMLSKTPNSIVDKPDRLLEFWQNKDISHIHPIAINPELQGDPENWFPEDAQENRSKNIPGYIRSEDEKLEAFQDNEEDILDLDYDDDGQIDFNL